VKLRKGEWIAIAGIGCMIASLLAPWYESAIGNLDFWDTFGGAAVLMLASLSAALAMIAATLVESDSPAVAVPTAVWSAVIGFVGTIAAIVRVLERPEHATGLCAGAWLGLAGALLILIGSWIALSDERTSRFRPAEPEPRPRP
jgi:hypothetical protein